MYSEVHFEVKVDRILIIHPSCFDINVSFKMSSSFSFSAKYVIYKPNFFFSSLILFIMYELSH